MSAPIGYYDVSNMSSKFHINISVFVWFAQTNHGVLYCIYYTSFCMVKLHPISRQLSPLRGHTFPKPVLCSKQTPASAGNTKGGVACKHPTPPDLPIPARHNSRTLTFALEKSAQRQYNGNYGAAYLLLCWVATTLSQGQGGWQPALSCRDLCFLLTV